MKGRLAFGGLLSFVVMNSLIQIHSVSPAVKSKRKSVGQRMQHLGIEDADYKKYEQAFLRSRQKHHFILKTKGSWVEIKRPWRQNQVLRHLAGEQTIGLFPADQLDYLMIDIDRHDDEDEAHLTFRIEKIKRVFPGDPLIYQSSFSGGIRLCYFLEKPVPREGLYRGCKKFFEQNGLTLRSGSIEIMATRKADRLPFGAGSYLVDPFTFEPIFHLTLRETILIAHRVFRYQKIQLPFEIDVPKESGTIHPEGSGVFDLIVGRLYEEGLYPQITTNEALLKLSWDLIVRKGYAKEEAESFLISWVRQKHNSCSYRFNAGRADEITRQIQRIVRATNPGSARYPGSRYALRKKRLSLSDVCKITLLTDEPKLQQAVFSLLEYCLCFGKKVKDKVNKKGLISNIYVSENGGVTYGSGLKRDFYCEISKKTLQHLAGFDKAYPHKTRQKIEALGILSPKREAHPSSHRCRHYWVHYRFETDDPVKVVSLDEGLLKLQQLRRKQNDYKQNKTAREVSEINRG